VTNALSGSIATETGLMTITFQPVGIGKVTRTGVGVVLQNSNTAYGAFIGNKIRPLEIGSVLQLSLVSRAFSRMFQQTAHASLLPI
jgi:hypothetical protein